MSNPDKLYELRQLSSKEVDKLYKAEPKLDDPYFKGKTLLDKIPNGAIFKITIKGKEFIVRSDAKKGDEWYMNEASSLNEKASESAHVDAIWSIWDKHFSGDRNPEYVEQGNRRGSWVMDIYTSDMDDKEFKQFRNFSNEVNKYLKKNKLKYQDKGDQFVVQFNESVNEADVPPKFVVFKGKKILGFSSNQIQARKAASKWKAEYMDVETYKKKYGPIKVKESVNEAKKNIKGKVLGTIGNYKIFKDKKLGDVIILIIGSGSNQFEVPIKVKPSKIDNARQKYYVGRELTVPNPLYKESVNEASKKSVTKIAKELEALGKEMKKHAIQWKTAKDEKEKAKHVAHLKTLTAKKRALENDMDHAISGIDADAELVANEHVLRAVIRQKIRETIKT